MALETLKDVTEIDGFEVTQLKTHITDNFLEISQVNNAITFVLQDGPVKDNGVNGCQIDTIVEACIIIIEGLNEQVKCDENKRAAMHMRSALHHLKRRKEDREKRGVEGTCEK